MSHYRYATLDPRPTQQAREGNNAVFASGPVYGLEVTVPALADRCAANLDPQHLGGDASTAAVEAAVTWDLPPAGATLATVRADADSLGAMAVLGLRAAGRDVSGAAATIKVIADADKEASGPWSGPRPAATADDLVGSATPVMGVAADHTVPLPDRVAALAGWLMGDWEGVYSRVANYTVSARAEAEAALEALDVQVFGPVAVVTGTHRLALAIGYRHAPVVVATNPGFRWQGGEPHVKHTVARWNTTTIPGMDWEGMVDALNREDPAAQEAARWGGSTSIAGSPQGAGSGLSTLAVAATVYQAAVGREAAPAALGRENGNPRAVLHGLPWETVTEGTLVRVQAQPHQLWAATLTVGGTVAHLSSAQAEHAQAALGWARSRRAVAADEHADLVPCITCGGYGNH